MPCHWKSTLWCHDYLQILAHGAIMSVLHVCPGTQYSLRALSFKTKLHQKHSLTSLTMSRTSKEYDAINGKKPANHNDVAVDDEDDLDMMDDTYLDEHGRFNLSKIFPNSDDNSIKYDTRDATGRVMSVECCLKVPKKQVQQSTNTTPNNGGNEAQGGQPKAST